MTTNNGSSTGQVPGRSSLRETRLRIEEQIRKREAHEQTERERNTSVVEGQKWQFVVENVQSDWVGADGRSRKGVGWRYGFPHEDRKRGLIKVPTSVD